MANSPTFIVSVRVECQECDYSDPPCIYFLVILIGVVILFMLLVEDIPMADESDTNMVELLRDNNYFSAALLRNEDKLNRHFVADEYMELADKLLVHVDNCTARTNRQRPTAKELNVKLGRILTQYINIEDANGANFGFCLEMEQDA